ncbi:MAG: hypothetical protein WBF04_07030 [Candidatus Sulfotelmatobacter sp.]
MEPDNSHTSADSPTNQGQLTISEIRVRQTDSDSVEMVRRDPAGVREMRTLLRALQHAQSVDFNSDVTWYRAALVRAIHRAGIITLHRVFPCQHCGHPVACLRLWRSKRLFVIDAVEEPVLPGEWDGDIFAEHICGGLQ